MDTTSLLNSWFILCLVHIWTKISTWIALVINRVCQWWLSWGLHLKVIAFLNGLTKSRFMSRFLTTIINYSLLLDDLRPKIINYTCWPHITLIESFKLSILIFDIIFLTCNWLLGSRGVSPLNWLVLLILEITEIFINGINLGIYGLVFDICLLLVEGVVGLLKWDVGVLLTFKNIITNRLNPLRRQRLLLIINRLFMIIFQYNFSKLDINRFYEILKDIVLQKQQSLSNFIA